ncbi:tRNA glutamyl-Q(34) synthetase GluQRS [Aliiglaciecola sp. CAU 1673]|uniref:tRNA glutamyl-Q(34) synthetase GluQRS n=1 Tax=Aliiglaciecola sp. CAU 1673 TaxID=3032595 RepID=UPI0023DCCA74|nr:tRNA glutamyl-Q(34) synthetase GluQRS [Aliiglaciecola sp. CAU 1673]MDF2177808.1 tRNA glutamyl-Q(34) synthetase GluQRS [Aliiglaciecola sp. CAU 1673]
MPNPYKTRFAPSPSGPLHLGSLVAALGSYLQAKKQGGQWLVRIEDIDPPREMPGASDMILQSLEDHHLYWDGMVTYQSQHSDYYEQALAGLSAKELCYACRCTRAQIKAAGGFYPGTCRDLGLSLSDTSLRFRNVNPVRSFIDERLGLIEVNPKQADEDFIIKRKDGLYAYHLAVVVDDIRQGITQVVRGADLLEASVSQIALYEALEATPPSWLHLPIAMAAPGLKLSKQNRAPALEATLALNNLKKAGEILGLPNDLQDVDNIEQFLALAIRRWRHDLVSERREYQMNQV